MEHEKNVAQSNANEWEFANHVIYSITLYTKNHTPWLGVEENGQIQLTDVGQIAYNEWLQTPVHRPYILLDKFILLPESIQMILMVKHRSKDISTENLQIKTGTLESIVNHFKRSTLRKCRKHGHSEFAWQEEYEGHQITSLYDLETMRQFINNYSS